MKPPPFEYLAPDTLDGALAALNEHGYDAKLLAGGQSLIPAMNFRMAQPAVLIDLNPALSLNYVERDDLGGLRLGAMTRQRQLERNSLVAEHAPLLHETMPYIAHPQIRNRGTLGGSLAHADPAAELPVIMVALDARFGVRSARRERWIAAADFFLGMFTTDLAAEEALVEVTLPPMPAGTGYSFMEVARRRGDYAMVGLAALVTVDDRLLCQRARLVYLNVGEGPMDAREAAASLLGSAGQDEAIENAATIAAEREIDPVGNMHASADFQRHLARVLTRRALRQAFERARQR
jgi:carbon-monoxide dehydrogenase medium subunit